MSNYKSTNFYHKLHPMLFLKKIDITYFKNYEIRSFEFSKHIIGIYGNNGIGKTNLLDAIYYCCFSKSYFNANDQLNIGIGKDGFRLLAQFLKNNEEFKVLCKLKSGLKKEIAINEIVHEKLSQHLGLFPCVMIAPDDIEIINGGSELRRKYIDTILSQLDNNYLQALIQYNKLLQQRNSFLKNAAASGNTDFSLLEILDMQLETPATIIFNTRKLFLTELIPIVQSNYQTIAGTDEKIMLNYESKLIEKSFKQLLTENRQKDFILQRTNVGTHKDDISIELFSQSFKSIASQGQKKSLLFALKLAEYELIKKNKGFAPLLLLDDVFEKLDFNRMNNLLQIVGNDNDGQVIITDTHKDRLVDTFNKIGLEAQIIAL
jgi:DNA replication and repair protein RecF